MEPQIITEGSWQPTNIGAIFDDLGHQVAVLDEVRGHSLATDVRDRILLSLTAIQNDLDSKIPSGSGQRVETAKDITRNLEILFRLIDCRDLLMSYSSSQLIKKLAVHLSYQDVIEVALRHQWSEMLSFRCVSAAGVLHRVEILRDIFSKRFTSSLCVDFAAQGLHTVIGSLLVEQWEEFLRFLFNSNSNEVHQSHLYPNIVLSTCSLWIKLIRRDVQKSSIRGSDSTHFGKIFCLTDVLLETLKTGSLSQICHRKCLGVLLECLPYSAILSPLKLIPSLYHELAQRNLRAFKNSGVDDLPVENRDDVSRNFHLGTSWIEHCVMRSSISQGFGGFCSTGKSRSDAGVDGESALLGVKAVDETVLRKLVLLWLRSLAVEAHGPAEEGIESSVDDVWPLLNSLESFVCSLLSLNPNVWLMRLFDEQDDDLFEALLCLLDIYVLTADKRSSDVCCRRFDPCRFFLQFLASSGCWDHTLLLDLLMSPETCFLLYLTRLLRHILSDWGQWVSVCRNHDDDKEDSVVSAAESVVDLSKEFSSCDNNASLDEFKNAFESVEMKRSCSVERFQPVLSSSLKQLEQNYTSQLNKENSGSVTENEYTLLGNSVAGPSYSSSFLSGKSDAVPDLCPNDVRNRSSLKKIIDYSDSDSDGSELSADQDRSLENDVKPGSSKRDISSDDRLMVTDTLLGYSGDEAVKTSENCSRASAEVISFDSTNSLRIVKEVDAETDPMHSSSSYKYHALDYSKYSSFGSSEKSELSNDSDSPMDIETDCAESDVTYDDVAKKEREEELGTSVGVVPAMDPTNVCKEKCDVLVDAMTTLIRLRLCLTRLVSKDIFPYSIGPLERLLNSCEERYEKV